MSAMTNPSDEQNDSNQPADAPTPPPPSPTEQTPTEQPPNPYGGASYDQNPPVPPAPTAAYGQTPPPAGYGAQPGHGAQPGYGQAPYGSPAAYGGQVGTPDGGATTSMVLGIIGLAGSIVCGLPIVLSPFALFMGLAAKKRIDASNGALTGRGNAQAGFILGIIGTVLLVLSIILVVVFIIIGISGGFDGGSSYDSYDSEF